MQTDVAWMLPKNSPLTGLVNHHLRRFFEKGLADRLYRRWTRAIQEKEKATTMNGVSLGYENTVFAFVVLVAGIAIAFVGVVMEAIISLVDACLPKCLPI